MIENRTRGRIPTFWQICLGVMVVMGIAILVGPAFSEKLEGWFQGGPGGLKNQGTALLFIGSVIIGILAVAYNRSLNPIDYVPELSAAVFLPLGTLLIFTEENPLLTGGIIVVLVVAIAVIVIALLILLLIRKTPRIWCLLASRGKDRPKVVKGKRNTEDKSVATANVESYYHIQLASPQGEPLAPAIKIRAEEITGQPSMTRNGLLKLKLDGKTVATFTSSRVSGWWIGQE